MVIFGYFLWGITFPLKMTVNFGFEAYFFHINCSRFCTFFVFFQFFKVTYLNTLSGNPTNWSNTLKEIVGGCRRIARVCFNILWVWSLKG